MKSPNISGIPNILGLAIQPLWAQRPFRKVIPAQL
jgi:hypothetical protein